MNPLTPQETTPANAARPMKPGVRRLRAVPAQLLNLADLFAWPLRTSHYLELLNPLWATHTLRARVEEVREETDEARTLTLRPGRGWRRHRAGQHIRVGVPVSGKQLLRTYSISSAPERSDGRITITVKAMAGGRVSHEMVHRVRPGSYLQVGLPQGEFVLPEAMPARPLFLTAGSGITPVMSMLRGMAARGAMPDVVHQHFAPRLKDVIFGEELEQLSRAHPGYFLDVIETRAAESGRSAESPRRFSAERLATICPDWRERDAYACGPQGLLAAIEAHWEAEGLSSRLHIERFRAPQAEPPAGATGGRVTFVLSGPAREADARTSLLRVAEEAGLSPAHGCRMGICHTCDVVLRSGCVRDLRNNKLTSEPGTTMQICVSAAAGAVELEL